MTQTRPQRRIYFRFVAALLLLAPAVLFTWRTMDGLTKRRLLRMDQAEIGHVRYSMLNADRWVDQILPILNGKIDARILRRRPARACAQPWSRRFTGCLTR